MSDVSDKLATCLQRVMRVRPVEFGERHDTRTSEQHCTASDRRPTNQVSAWQAERGSRPTRRHPCENPREKTSFVEFKLNAGRERSNTAATADVTCPADFKLVCRTCVHACLLCRQRLQSTATTAMQPGTVCSSPEHTQPGSIDRQRSRKT